MRLARLLILSLAPAATIAKGINCRGSFLCKGADIGESLPQVRSGVHNVMFKDEADLPKKPARIYEEGEQIVCTEGRVCAYYQNGARGTARQAYELITKLAEHGCHECGNVAVRKGGLLKQGMLTVGYQSLKAAAPLAA